MGAGYVVAVVGATGAAGSTTLKILEERKFPVSELRCYASERSAGKNVAFRRGPRGFLASPTCTPVVTVMPLKPLHDAARLRRVIATSYQAVSGAGVRGVEELRRQTLAWARGEGLTVECFPHQI